MSIIFEIGANRGTHTQSFLSPDNFVYAFEPSYPLYCELSEKFKDQNNLLVLPFAVDVENSIKNFNVSLVNDRGVGSLYNFHPELQNTVLSRYTEFKKFDYSHNVLTIRLDTFMENWNVSHIDYLHIDAQGSDFNCIKSLGNRISDVKEGVCECVYKISIYDKVDNYYEDVKKYLDEVGNFKVEVAYEHEHHTEIDLRFYR